jgi:hypothetical protein
MLTTTGLQFHVALDKRDDAIEDLITATAELDALTRLLLIDANDDVSECESDSESSCDEGVADDLQELVKSIKVYTDCLTDLSSALVCPALEPEYDNEPSAVISATRSVINFHTEQIRAKFPSAEMTLLQCLGRASWDRSQRMQRGRDSNAQIISTQDGKSGVAELELQDSGVLKSLLRGASTCAETVISFATSIFGGERVNISPLPPSGKKRLLFDRSAYGNSIKATSNHDWRSVFKYETNMFVHPC